MIRRFQKYRVMAHNRARTGNPWLEKLFTENVLLFVITEPGPATHGWKNFSQKMHLFFLCHGTPLKRTGAKLRENPR